MRAADGRGHRAALRRRCRPRRRSVDELRESFDARRARDRLARAARPAACPDATCDGVHFAMDYLYQRNRFVARESAPRPTVAQPADGRSDQRRRQARGGDRRRRHRRGLRRQLRCARAPPRSCQLELLPEPPAHRPDERTPWPEWPLKYRLTYAMEEAREAGVGEQDYSVRRPHASAATRTAAWRPCTSPGPNPRRRSSPVEGTERELPAQLVLLAMGFLAPRAGPARPARRREGPARQRQGRQALHDLRRRRLRRRRRAPRPVADRVGDQRGSPVRADGRPLPRRPAGRNGDARRWRASPGFGRGFPGRPAARGRRPVRPRRRRRGPRGPAAARQRRGQRRITRRAGGATLGLR